MKYQTQTSCKMALEAICSEIYNVFTFFSLKLFLDCSERIFGNIWSSRIRDAFKWFTFYKSIRLVR